MIPHDAPYPSRLWCFWIRQFRKRYGLDRYELANYLEVDAWDVLKWEWMVTPIPYNAQCKMVIADDQWEHKRR